MLMLEISSYMMVNNDIFLSFQLTSRRQVVLRKVVKARKEKYIKK